MKCIHSLFLLAMLTAVDRAEAGAVVEWMTTEYSDGTPVVGTIEVSTEGKSSRLEITSVTSNESGGMIYRSDRKEMIAIDHEAKEYYVIDEPTLALMADRVRESTRQVEQALAAMTPEERAVAEQMLPNRTAREQFPAAESELKATGENDIIAGYACSYYDVLYQGRKVRDLCITDWDKIEAGRQAARAMKEFSDFFAGMRDAFTGAGGLDALDRQQEMFVYMDRLKGYPVLSRDYDAEGNSTNETRLKSARTSSIDAALFKPPPGYAERAIQ